MIVDVINKVWNPVSEITPGAPFDLAYAFRLARFLVTMVPFMHAAILTFSLRWYRDTDEKDHFGLSLVFFHCRVRSNCYFLRVICLSVGMSDKISPVTRFQYILQIR